MIRIEIVANQSVQDEIIDNFEQVLPGFLYTVIPVVQGRGKNTYKLGDVTWPETNFVLFAYLDDSMELTTKHIVRYIKLKFPTEGIKLFILHDAAVK